MSNHKNNHIGIQLDEALLPFLHKLGDDPQAKVTSVKSGEVTLDFGGKAMFVVDAPGHTVKVGDTVHFNQEGSAVSVTPPARKTTVTKTGGTGSNKPRTVF